MKEIATDQQASPIDSNPDTQSPIKPSKPISVEPSSARSTSICLSAAAGVICLIAISHRSLWIDEALTALTAMQPTLHSWWQRLVQEKTSDLQMPLYMLYMWAYEKVFGPGEWALRLANLPWFLLGAAAYMKAASNGRRSGAAILLVSFVVLFSPFAWYYLDEARPYAMQIGASLLIAAALFGVHQAFHAPRSATEQALPPLPGGEGWLAAPKSDEGGGEGERHSSSLSTWAWPFISFLLGLFILCGSSLLGMIWAAAAVGVLFVLLIESKGTVPWSSALRTRDWFCFVVALALLFPFGLYYLWTIKIGARASDSGGTGLSSLLFSAYELLGFSGLGPSRLQIRTQGFASFREHWAGVTLYAIALGSILGTAIFFRGRRFSLAPSEGESGGLPRRSPKKAGVRGPLFPYRCAIAICCASPIILISGAGLLLHFRVLGRHFAPFLPIIIVILASGLAALWCARKWWTRGLAALFCMLTICSCFSLRFASRHEKDDYRSAAAFAKMALREGRTVWWNAAEEGARYYRLPVTREPAAGTEASLVLANPVRNSLESLPVPQLIITSRPDIYDNASSVQTYLHEHHFQPAGHCTAFTFWTQ